MATKTIDTEKEKDLSNRRKGARKVRSAIQEHIGNLRTSSANSCPETGVILDDIENFISSMIERDKKRKGGLWN